MAIISQEYYYEQCRSKTILQFAKEFKLARLLEQANIRKAKGIGVQTIFIHLLTVAFSGKSLNQLLASGELSGKKDAFYRFMNSTSANWLNFIRMLSSKLVVRLKQYFYNESGMLILDDTLHKRDRSKKVELLTRVRDHNDGRYYRGFRCLTLCFHIASTIVPLDFRILSSQTEKTRINGSRQDLDKRTNGYKLRQYAISNTFNMVYDLLSRQRGLVRHVLFDSWFAEPVMFTTLREMGFHGVGMLKAKKGALYRYKGKWYNLEALHALVKPFIHREHAFASIGVELRNGTAMSITFIQDKHRKRDWLAVATTDLSLSPEQVISLYSRRWNIEVFFKTVKSCLGFAQECLSRSFDAIVCSVSVVFTRHMILTWLNLSLPNPETDGQVYLRLFDEFHECTLSEALIIVLREIAAVLNDFENLLNISLLNFIELLPCAFNYLLVSSNCET
jgi:hypothetical protein